MMTDYISSLLGNVQYGGTRGGSSTFGDFQYVLGDPTIMQILLPFILIFTLVYAVLQKSKILGKDSKRFNVMLALVMGLGVVIPHIMGYYERPSIVDIINRALPQVSLVVVAVIMFLLVLGIFGKDVSFIGTSLSGWAVIFSLIAVVAIFGNAAGWYVLPEFLYFLNNPQIQSLVVVILVFGVVIAFITGEPDDDEGRKLSDAMEDIGEVLGRR
jgi:hypothetical protein